MGAGADRQNDGTCRSRMKDQVTMLRSPATFTDMCKGFSTIMIYHLVKSRLQERLWLVSGYHF